MTERRTCDDCGGSLPPDAPAGACPRCLLAAGLELEDEAEGVEAADEAPSDEAVDPLASGADEATPLPEAKSPPPRKRPEPPPVAEVAEHFPALAIEELIGFGGMGIVYRARQRSLDRVVALKVLWPELASETAFADRFTREARAMARLDHPHIVRVFEFGERNGLYFLVMEYVDGVNLRELMDGGEFEPRQALSIVPQVCDALQYAHDQGVVHRDIKPANVLIDKAGRVRIADFGLAKLVEGEDVTLTRAGQVMGTLHYMAPEQYRTPDDVDHRADIYSLGVVFYEMLTGDMPVGRFQAPSKKVTLDVRLDEVVLRTLEREPDRRYQRASDVATAMSTISGDVRSPEAPFDSDSRVEGEREEPSADGVAEPADETDEPAESRSATFAWSSDDETTGRLSKLAVAASLLLLTQIVFGLIGLAVPEVILLSIGSGATAMIVGLVAWIRVARSNGALHGIPYAVAGTFLPLLTCCAGAALGVMIASANGVADGINEIGRSGPVYVGPDGVRLGEIVISEDGVRVGDSIEIGEDGVVVKEPLTIDDRGIRPTGETESGSGQAVWDPSGVHVQYDEDLPALYVTGGPGWMDNDGRSERIANIQWQWIEAQKASANGTLTRETSYRYYRNEDRDLLGAMDDARFARKRAHFELGAPLYPLDPKDGDLSMFNLTTAHLDADGQGAQVTATGPEYDLVFRMLREHGNWYFEVGYVKAAREGLAIPQRIIEATDASTVQTWSSENHIDSDAVNAITSLWTRLTEAATDGALTRETAAPFYAPSHRRDLMKKSETTLVEQVAADELGVPFVSKVGSMSLAEFSLRHVDLTDRNTRARAKATAGGFELRFTLVRDGDEWFFELGPVERNDLATTR